MENLIQEAYGPHLIVDGYDCIAPGLGDVGHVYHFLDVAPAEIGMTKIMPPYVFRYNGGAVPEDHGVSGFVLIAESHISIHTYPVKHYLSVDIFSCKDFDHDRAIKLIVDFFGVGRYDEKRLTRGLEFPRDIKVVARHMVGERT
jgi:S-adenosylmethionine decarboxylase